MFMASIKKSITSKDNKVSSPAKDLSPADQQRHRTTIEQWKKLKHSTNTYVPEDNE
jgi:hypothetical protein